MAAYNGHFYGFPKVDSGDSLLVLRNNGWCSKMDSAIVITNHYHKRGWRTESSEYVEWDSTDRNAPYPGGGTVEPSVGVVVYQWVTYGG